MSEVFRALVDRNGVREELEILRDQNGFDGMTGEPVYTYRIANGFDGMTGEPLYADVEQFEYDGMTGQPVYRIKEETVFQAEPLKKIRNSVFAPDLKKFLPIICVASGVILLAVILLTCVAKGAFLSKRDKVALAAYRTIQDSTFGEMLLNADALLQSNELTTQISAEGSFYGYNGKVNATTAQNRKKGELYMNADVDVADTISQEVYFSFDDSSIRFSMPDIDDQVFCYHYAKENDGAIASLVDRYTDGSIEDVNTILECINNMYKQSGDYRKELKSAIRQAYKSVDVERIDSEEFEVNGKERRCKGYEMLITEENLADFTEAVMDATTRVYDNDAKELAYAVASLTGDKSIAQTYEKTEDGEEVAELVSDEKDISLVFYLYGGKLAAVRTTIDNETVTVEFRGGDSRCSNVEVIIRNKDAGTRNTFALESSRSGNREKGQFYVDNVSVASYSYDLKKGSYSVDLVGFSTDGLLLVTKKNLKFQSELSGKNYAKLKVNIQNGARIPEIKGDPVDVGRIGQDEMERISTRFVRQIMNSTGVMDYLF